MPFGFSHDVEQPGEMLVRRDVLAFAGTPSVEAHAADPGPILRVCQRGKWANAAHGVASAVGTWPLGQG